MAINRINNAASHDISKAMNATPEKKEAVNKSETINESVESEKIEVDDTVNSISQKTNDTEKAPVRGDEYISSEKELKDASGLYSVLRKSEGGMEIKFDDIKLQKKRNDLKSEITRLKSSNAEEDRKKTAELTKKLASVEKKIRMQKQK